jgi:hypothetical protein
MSRRRKPRSHSPHYPRRWPWVLGWTVALALAITALLGLGYLVSRGAPQDPSPVAELLQTASTKGVAVALAVVLLTVIAWCFRHLWFDWLAWRPGRIAVDAFTADSSLVEADVARYTLGFRKRLADLRMRAPAPVPGAGPEGDFLEVLGRGGVDSRNWLGSALSLLRAAQPQHTWQVTGVLVQRHSSPHFGLTVQVQRLPDQANPPTTHWAHDWDEAVVKGADEATAAILPRTGRCGAPWASWKRFRMSGELIGAYEDALGFEHDRRYDEALEAYYRASGMDPMNPALRLHIGLLQEKLALYLDALATYEGILGAGLEGLGESRAAQGERRRSTIAAMYRRIVLLGGDDLANQWRKTGPRDPKRWNRRDIRREELRARLRRQLEPALEPLASNGGERRRYGTRSLQQLLDPKPGTNPKVAAEVECRQELQELFALLALSDVQDMEALLHRADRRLVLSPDSIRLTALCIHVRLDSIQSQLGRESDWPPHPKLLEQSINQIEPKAGFSHWHEHYNAACAYALPLRDLRHSDIPKEERRRSELVKLAVGRLEDAAAQTDSAYLVGRRDWLLSEDPDLDGLREDPRFTDFEAVHLPAERRTPWRPPEVKKLENARYIKQLLVGAANRWEEVWHNRWEELERRSDVHVALTWWADECEAWRLVGQAAFHYGHWHSRWTLIERMREWARIYDFKPLEVPFPRYEDDPLVKPRDSSGTDLAEKAADAAAKRFEAIGVKLRQLELSVQQPVDSDLDPDDLRQMDSWQRRLRQLDAAGREPRRLVLAVLCDHHAALWQRLGEWLESDADPKNDPKERAFSKEVVRTSQLWCPSHRVKRTGVLVMAGGRAAIYRRRGSRNGTSSPRQPV